MTSREKRGRAPSPCEGWERPVLGTTLFRGMAVASGRGLWGHSMNLQPETLVVLQKLACISYLQFLRT